MIKPIVISLIVCALAWYFIDSTFIKVMITIGCMCVIWLLHEMKRSPIKDDIMHDENQYGKGESKHAKSKTTVDHDGIKWGDGRW